MPGLTLIRAALAVNTDTNSTRGTYLEQRNANLDKVLTLVDRCVELGLYCIIDWHAHYLSWEAVPFFRAMARRYRATPNVIFEIFNEPWRNLYDWKELTSYYGRVIDAIRDEEDQEHVCIVGTQRWSQTLGDALTHPLNYSNVAYSLHPYFALPGHDFMYEEIAKFSSRLPIFVTEFGHGCPHIRCDVNRDRSFKWIALLEQRGIPWANWHLSDVSSKIDDSLSILCPGSSSRPQTVEDWCFTAAGNLTRELLAKFGGQ